MMKKNQMARGYIIGVDGGGAKTTAVLANLGGKILVKTKTGPSNPDKIGMEKAILNIRKAIKEIFKKYQKEKVNLIYLALAAGLERDENKKIKIKKLLLKHPEFNWLSPKKIIVAGDQLPAFRSGTEEKEGILLISGSGCVAIGWRKERKAIAGGWDWLLGDEGSGFWIGQMALRAVCRDLDSRGRKTQLTNLIFKKWRIKKEKELMRRIYFDYQKDIIKQISSLASLVDKAAEKEDRVAKEILIEAGKELTLAVNQVIKKLNFKKIKFPLVLVGGTFNSKIILGILKKEIKKFAPKVYFIRPETEPVIGVVKLALEQIK